MRIAYGVFGYGRGHATRAAAVLPGLMGRHELLVLAGGDAHDHLSATIPVIRIPTLGYHYGPDGRRSNYRTMRQNSWHVLDILFRGPVSQQVTAALRDFRPDIVISDAEPWTHRAARRLGIPRIGFDHFGILAHCRVPLPLIDWARSFCDVGVYRALMGNPQRVIVSSFFDARPRRGGVALVGPLLRDEVSQFRAEIRGHFLAYFNKGVHQFTRTVESSLQSLPGRTLVYGTERRGLSGNLDFRPTSNLPFVEDLATCRAVISTAGNQLVGEAIHFGKPLLVMPENCVEQRMNAAAVQRLGIGMATTFGKFGAADIERFVAREGVFRERMRDLARNGRAEALATIERCMAELVVVESGAAAQSSLTSTMGRSAG